MSPSSPRSRQIVLAARPKGKALRTDFRLQEVPIPDLRDAEVLLSVRYLSLDPYMRGRMDDRKSYSPPTPIGAVLEGEVIAEVTASNNPEFQLGEMVMGRLGWQTHAISSGTGLTKLDPRFSPITTALGVLGMPGFTAYAGLLNIGKPQPGETVVVAAATGPVGSLVGQIARIKGASAVGIAGGKEKCASLRDEFGFNAAVDHRAPDFADQLAAACPNGIDVYFENVGGAVWEAVLPLLNTRARVPLCGLIAQYNGATADGPDRFPQTMREILSRSIMLQGFINYQYKDQRPQFLNDVSRWLSSGRVHFREQIVKGLENAPDAFLGMLEGKNFGKLIVDVASSH